MFAFKLWSRFGAFRDPITVTQNVTLSIPPKTTIGGMLAAILGVDYNDYFENPNYFDFQYSLVLKNPVRKQSFSQNYIEDYTAKSHLKQQTMQKVLQKAKAIEKYINQTGMTQRQNIFDRTEDTDSVEEEKLVEKQNIFKKEFAKFRKHSNQKMPKPKPIRRELLLEPYYLVFINDFIFDNEIVKLMKSHNTGFALYMGNSEFSANYEFLECVEWVDQKLSKIDSFTQSVGNIKFETGRKYTSVYAATKTVEGRKYRDYKKITICDDTISFNIPVQGTIIKTEEGSYNCEFI